MRRRYFVRQKEVQIEEIENVAAVRLDARGPAEAGRRLEAMRAVAPPGIDAAALKPFERANWRFLTRNEAVSGALAVHREIDGSTEIGRLFRRANGRLAIGTNKLAVQLDPQLTPDQCLSALSDRGLQVVRQLKFGKNLYEVVARVARDSVEASEQLQSDPRFLLAEPVFVEQIEARASPNDPGYARQWHLKNVGQGGGVAGADIGAEAAWAATRGTGIRIAVIDNGFDASHEDLAAGLDAMSGYFVEPSGEFRQSTVGIPVSEHGTFCAGIVGARQGNDVGVSGVAPECRLILIACLDDQVGTQLTLARALAYAADPQSEVATAPAGMGADIIVCSLGPNDADWELQDVLRLAIEHAAATGRNSLGCPIFWAASNGNVDISEDEVVSHPDAIAVGRSSNRDLENDSAHGPKLEYLAPGVRVYSALPGNQYGLDTGTSFAAPCAAGVAALALAFRPAMTRIELRQLMIDACDKIGTLPYVNGRNDDYGYGRVSAKNAIALLQARVPERTPAALARGAERAVADRGDIYRYQLSAKSLDELRELLKGARLDLGCRAIARQDGDEFHVDAYATEEEVAGLQARTARRASSVRIERRQNITAEGRERMHEVSRSNRFSAARGLPQGLGVKE